MRRSCFGTLALTVCLLTACEGRGDGELTGTLFLRGCPSLDPTSRHDSGAVPSPLPSYSLGPHFFYAEAILGIRTGLRPDPRPTDRLLLRMQRGANKLERSDGFELLVHDLSKLEELQSEALIRGEAGAPIVPPPLDASNAPLPTDPDSTVRAGLVLNNSCRYPLAQPSLRGHVRFTEIGRRVGDVIAGEVQVAVEDLRAARQQGGTAVVPDVAGALHGWFRIPVQAGPASPAQ